MTGCKHILNMLKALHSTATEIEGFFVFGCVFGGGGGAKIPLSFTYSKLLINVTECAKSSGLYL